MKQTIRIACKGSSVARLDDLQHIQGNLKDLSKKSYEQLKKQILERGFSAPFFVWKSESGIKLLDGHQRLRAIRQMYSEGILMPAEFPIVEVEAKDLAEARLKLLSFASQYGEVTAEGLDELAREWDIATSVIAEDYRMPEINMKDFSGLDEDKPKSLKTCPECGHKF